MFFKSLLNQSKVRIGLMLETVIYLFTHLFNVLQADGVIGTLETVMHLPSSNKIYLKMFEIKLKEINFLLKFCNLNNPQINLEQKFNEKCNSKFYSILKRKNFLQIIY